MSVEGNAPAATILDAEIPPQSTVEQSTVSHAKAAQDIQEPIASNPSTTAVTPPAAPAVAEKSSAALTLLEQFSSELPSIISKAGFDEIWGVTLKDSSDTPTSIVLEKFLRANVVNDKKDVTKAKAQLIEALQWRKETNPRKLLEETEFDFTKFGGLGFVTIYPKEGSGKEIVTWNIYGAVKDNKKTFGDVEAFIKWRSALMELSVKELNLAAATERIPENGIDPYRMVQVHDYLNVAFFRMDSDIRAASKETIRTFSMAYPELLKEKFFVNVPLVMGWVFTAMKLFLSADTIKKFHPLSYGSSLAGFLPGIGAQLPTAYGGQGQQVTEGLTVKYTTTQAGLTAKA